LDLELNKPDGDHTKGELWWWVLEVLVRGSGMKLLAASAIHMTAVLSAVAGLIMWHFRASFFRLPLKELVLIQSFFGVKIFVG